MRKYIVKRILISIVILFFVGFIIYALMRCLPSSFIENMARQKSMPVSYTHLTLPTKA